MKGTRPEGRVTGVRFDLADGYMVAPLAEVDPEIYEVLGRELERQRNALEMIASENFVCFVEEDMREVARIIVTALGEEFESEREALVERSKALLERHPLYPQLSAL